VEAVGRRHYQGMDIELSEGMESCAVKVVLVEFSGLRGDAELADCSKSDKTIHAHYHPTITL